MRNNSKTIGDLGELKFAAKFHELGYVVSKPLTDNAPYDLLIDGPEGIKRVQIKARCVRNGVVSIEFYNSARSYSYSYKHEDFDILAIYVLELDRYGIIQYKDIAADQKSLCLRIDPSKNLKSKSNLFEDIEI